MNKLFLILAITTTMASSAQVYKDPNATPQQRAESMVKEMTLDEKVSLMKHQSPAIPRLGIKQYNWWNEALHGVARAGLATVFPQPIGMAATFDDKLIFDVFTAVSDEARAKNQAAKAEGPLKIYQCLTFWTPNVNLYRDPRWGRGHETYGEDPYLTSKMGVSVVRGLQGDNYEGTAYTGPDAPKYYKLHACAKHFAVHSGPEWSRHIINVNYLRPRDLWETYLPAFKALVQEGGVKEVMCAYNRYDDEPCCGSNKLLGQILRQGWGYDGIVLTDCWALNDLFTEGYHHTEPDAEHAVAKALRSGTDLECGESFGSLVEAVEQGLVSEAAIDQAVIRLMKARYELGEMDDDSLVEWTRIPYSVVDNAEHRALATEVARQTMVLLKNDGILPLSPTAKVALLGPNANDSVMQWGNYNGFPSSTTTLLTALQNKLGAENVTYFGGIDHIATNKIESLLAQTQAKSGQVGFDAIYYNDRHLGNFESAGEPDVHFHYSNPLNLTTAGATVWAPGVKLTDFVGSYTTIFKPEVTEDVVFTIQTQGYAVLDVNGERVFKGGNLKSSNFYTLHAEAGKEYEITLTYVATEGGCASLTFDFGRPIPLDIDAIIDSVKDSDVVIFAGGLSPNLEGEEMPVSVPGFRGGDREIIELPEVQTQILEALHAAGKKVVYVNFSGSAIALTRESEIVDALLQAWYPGQDGGTAVAEVLYGDYNPAGRLPVTFYKTTADLPDIEDYNMENRTYRYFKGEALYPFGFGLSYTTFEYGDATAEADGDNVVLRVPVKNTGKRDGDEVVQVYLSRPDDAEGPASQLRAYKRVNIPADEEVVVEFVLTPEQFSWYDPAIENMRPMIEGTDILYGPSSASLKKAHSAKR